MFAPSRVELDQLAEAIRTHDLVDLSTLALSTVLIPMDEAILQRCYSLCFHLWNECDLVQLGNLATHLVSSGTLAPKDLDKFKEVRARAKQLRFIYAMLGSGHLYPPRLDRLTRIMGKVQDAVKHRRPLSTLVRAVLLRALLSRTACSRLHQELRRFTPATLREVSANIITQASYLEHLCKISEVTDEEFHKGRKVVSRLVALSDVLIVLAPSYKQQITKRFLATLNGLMGGLHDTMAERKAVDRSRYRTARTPIPEEIRSRMEVLVQAMQEVEIRT